MASKNMLAGRFLPSRVYARWKGTARFGLCTLPLILFLAGGVTYYFAPSRYQSTAVFQYLGQRTPREASALLKTQRVIFPVIEALELGKRLEVDKETAERILSDLIDASVDPDSGMITIQVTNPQKELARDIAAELPKALDAYERSLAAGAISVRLEVAEKAMTDAEDETAAKRQALMRLISLRGDSPADPLARIDVDAARTEWEHAHHQVLENRQRIADANRERNNLGKWVEIHSTPAISNTPVGKAADESLGGMILQALGVGLGFSLLAPYLLEFAFPRRSRRRVPVKQRTEWSEPCDEPAASGTPANS